MDLKRNPKKKIKNLAYKVEIIESFLIEGRDKLMNGMKKEGRGGRGRRKY